jgi:CNT family concentrative nucleoside transporter
MLHLQSAAGVVALLALAWALSENRRHVSLRHALAGLALTALVGAVLIYLPGAKNIFAVLNQAVDAISQSTQAGTSFVFGYLGGGDLPFALKPNSSSFILGIQALPLILVMSVLTTLFFYWGILPRVVKGFAWILGRTLGVGGAVGVSTAANVFVGMVEAPLFIRPYLSRLTRAELFMVMVGGMANIAGTVMVLYATFLAKVVPDAFGHILIASLMSAPAALTIARLMVPDDPTRTAGEMTEIEPVAVSTMDAISKATLAGVELLINVIAMLIVLIALVHLVNLGLGLLPDLGGAPVSLQRLLGWVMAPVCWLMGVPVAEAETAGRLMGVKTVLNEFIAYVDLGALPEEALGPRSRLIMTYALCGFANFASLGIMIGGLATMAPERRNEIADLGLKSIVAGTLTTCLDGAIVGVLT